MNLGRKLFSLALILVPLFALAQQPFTEGVIVYRVKMETADQRVITGTYSFTVKGNFLRKELKTDNGYHDITIINGAAGSVYSLQSANGQNFAIELSMDALRRRQQPYTGFTLSGAQKTGQQIVGLPATTVTVKYADSSATDVVVSMDWYPQLGFLFDRFPGASFIPLQFSYKEASDITMTFTAEKIDPSAVENSAFRIPHNYKVISNAEYLQINK